ncbi:4-diphosphocytidyl-2-C-methyl-D-erythritol kinase [Arthrobacter crystallopoietes BAB-32]|uniref:4-diphosphocytidyl-2-C-methyl-D-erythritol kinase n=1 Tax=Arthrobacter crystallopoietes BAB-32 TaxID=1246476 RepID=N1V1F7_9MICC|nr:4-(cytidine 5'-diphospho)-2-C-methyl-D-erythritol kinase [Arthrobacter crystallopoietes]EMY33814.1 4-diphosphocytidyl-2-C-methyl-D-erythritol kinase [Arthrobacter crystallopoietes BAB-32]
MSKTRSVRVMAPGKINVSFRMGPLRPDGYHSVASVYLAVSLYEEVTATRRDDDKVTVSVRNGSPLPLDVEDIPLDSSNLAVKAAELMRSLSAHPTGVHLDIVKRVPIAGGMGGGSADAAAALVACSALWDTGFSRDELVRIAADLGADVPFALLGGVAVGLGIGDQLTPALARRDLNWVLVPASFGLSTPKVYATADRLREEAGFTATAPDAVDPAILKAMHAGDVDALANALGNDLQAASIELAPELADILDLGVSEGALAGLVSGSGPTLAFLAADRLDAEELAQRLSDVAGVAAMAVHGPVHGARIMA